MRVRRSPMGSVTAIFLPSLPARLGHARDLAEIRKIAQRDTRQFHFPVKALGPSGKLAAMVNSHLRRVARKFRELEARVEALFRGHAHILRLRFQRGALSRIFRDHPFTLCISVDLAQLRHVVCSLSGMETGSRPEARAPRRPFSQWC